MLLGGAQIVARPQDLYERMSFGFKFYDSSMLASNSLADGVAELTQNRGPHVQNTSERMWLGGLVFEVSDARPDVNFQSGAIREQRRNKNWRCSKCWECAQILFIMHVGGY